MPVMRHSFRLSTLIAVLCATAIAPAASQAEHIANPYDDVYLTWQLETDFQVPPLFVNSLDNGANRAIELELRAKAVWKSNEIKFYSDPLPQDLGDRIYIDLDWQNVNDVTTGINWISFTNYWKAVDDPDYYRHGFKGVESEGNTFYTVTGDWVNLTDVIGSNRCTIGKLMNNLWNGVAGRSFGLAGDQLQVRIQQPDFGKSWLFKNNPIQYPLKYRIRNWRFYNPQHAGPTWQVTFNNPRGWDQVYVYAWGEPASGVKNYAGTWPGTLLTPDCETGLYQVSYKVPDAYGAYGITFNNGQGDYLKYAPDTGVLPVDGQTYEELLFGFKLELPYYSHWEQVYAYASDGRLGAYPGTRMLPWPGPEGPYGGLLRAPGRQRRAAATDDDDPGHYYLAVPAYAGDRLEVQFTGKDAAGNIVGVYPPEGSGQWIPLSDFQRFTLTAHPSPGAVTGLDQMPSADNAVPVTYYDLTGRPVARPSAGQLVIRRQGSKAIKVRF